MVRGHSLDSLGGSHGHSCRGLNECGGRFPRMQALLEAIAQPHEHWPSWLSFFQAHAASGEANRVSQ